MKKSNNLKLGIFVFVGIVILFSALFNLGLKEFMKPKITLYTLYDQSVQGLSIGSPVKFLGVNIGQVKDIKIQQNRTIRVDMEIDLSTFEEENSVMNADNIDSIPAYLTSAVEKDGLRCLLTSQGITGMKYIEIDYFKDNPFVKIAAQDNLSERVYIPSHPTQFDNAVMNITESLDRLASIDFNKMADSITNSLAAIERLTSDEKIVNILEEAEASIKDTHLLIRGIKDKVDVVDFAEISSNFNGTLNSFERAANTVVKKSEYLVNTFTEKLNSVSDGGVKTLNSIEGTSNRVDELVASVTPVVEKTGADLQRALEQLRRSLKSLENLTDLLEKDPGALLHGKSAK